MSLHAVGDAAGTKVEIRSMLESETAAIRTLMESTFEVYLRPIFYIHPESTLVAVAAGRLLGGIIAIATTLVEIALLAVLKTSWAQLLQYGSGGAETSLYARSAIQFLSMLCLYDIVLFFYPFSGFNASRIKRLSPWLTAATSVIFLAVIVFL